MVLRTSRTNHRQLCNGPDLNTLMLDNLEAYQHGKELPHIITKPFMETFTVGIGGSGMTLAVVLLMAFCS